MRLYYSILHVKGNLSKHYRFHLKLAKEIYVLLGFIMYS